MRAHLVCPFNKCPAVSDARHVLTDRHCESCKQSFATFFSHCTALIHSNQSIPGSIRQLRPGCMPSRVQRCQGGANHVPGQRLRHGHRAG